ncbi:hypothetical protein NQ176_g5569 [Zarea fungicola]|uniref:Uncharacterized protein n=1 Tax=Zarea fungicola TaxID=93591 RepID=A0ACC1N915_9HYPO|nr:hypothetical protein NQ176_g5569 [Lecanicillium fungicola]
MCDETPVQDDALAEGGGKAGGGDRPGVSASSLAAVAVVSRASSRQWSRVPSAALSVSTADTAVSRGVFSTAGPVVATEETGAVDYSAAPMGIHAAAQTCNNIPLTMADQSTYTMGMQQLQLQQQQQLLQWDLGNAMPVEYMENILDELF